MSVAKVEEFREQREKAQQRAESLGRDIAQLGKQINRLEKKSADDPSVSYVRDILQPLYTSLSEMERVCEDIKERISNLDRAISLLESDQGS